MTRPEIVLHFAQSLDGRIATRSGSARWISGPEATRFAHQLRAAADAVVIGSGTALTDDPLLTVRHDVAGRQPMRVVLDGRGRLGPAAKLLSDATAPTIHVTRAPRGDTPNHAERWDLPAAGDGEGVHLPSLLSRFAERGVKRVLVEGGRRVITSFLRGGHVDRVIVTIAPIMLGVGIDAVGDLGTERIEDAMRFTTERSWRLGDDVMIELTRRAEGSPSRDRS